MALMELYPEPPHLTIAIYPKACESECFTVACKLVKEFGCQPGGVVEVAPWGTPFELRSDLVERSTVLDVGRSAFDHIVAGDDAASRPIRAGYRKGRSGLAVVEYLAAPSGDRHPVAVSTSAEGLGIPVDLWRAPERSSATKVARWAVELLQALTTQCDALYGAIGVEYSLATPSDLATGVATPPSEFYLSRALAARVPGIQKAFMLDFQGGETVEWPSGWFFSGWGPFNSNNVTLPSDRIRPAAAGRLLGAAIVEGNVC
jgi:hypothetical protein